MNITITRQTLDPSAAPIEMGDHIHFLPDGTLHLVLDEDIFDAHFGDLVEDE